MNRLIIIIAVFFIFKSFDSKGQSLERLSYNNPDILVDLGVGLWAWPLPMDYNENGLIDLIVVCTDTPYNGVYFFENTGNLDSESDLPIYKPAQRLGDAVNNVSISYLDKKSLITSPGKWYPDFRDSAFRNPKDITIPASCDTSIFNDKNKIRANQWQYIDYNNDGLHDLMLGIGIWGDKKYKGIEFYGWDNAYNEKGQWTNGPLHGHIFVLQNIGTNRDPIYMDPIQIFDTDGSPLDVYGRPSPNFVDFNGDGKPDIICGEFRDGFTFFENVGSKHSPLFAPGKPLTNEDVRIHMDLCMITPVAYDFTGNGWPDLIVGDEDGRVALVEHTGKVKDGMPLFLAPRYFRQHADMLKFGALSTPFGYDWDGDGLDDIIVGNSAGNIAFIENLGGNPIKWAAPKLLKANDKVIRIMAGVNGSIQGPAESKWGYTTLTVADWNHNGLPDLIVNSIWGKILWYENIGTRTNPQLSAAKSVKVEWETNTPKPQWNWWDPEDGTLVSQWRTTPVAIDWTKDGLIDLVMLDHEGYLTLFRREKSHHETVLLPGARVFRLEGEVNPLQLNNGYAGSSGRRKISVVDFDGDGLLDILINSKNATFLKNIGQENGVTIFRDMGLLDERQLAGHTSSPTVIDLSNNGIPGLLLGAEDGFLYYKENPFIKKRVE